MPKRGLFLTICLGDTICELPLEFTNYPISTGTEFAAANCTEKH